MLIKLKRAGGAGDALIQSDNITAVTLPSEAQLAKAPDVASIVWFGHMRSMWVTEPLDEIAAAEWNRLNTATRTP